jgi:hypothetical protein
MFPLHISTMEEKVEKAADFLRKDESGKIASSVAMEFAGFSESERCDRSLQRKVLRKRDSSPEGIAVTTPSIECVEADKQDFSPITAAATASAVPTFSGGGSSSRTSL